MNRGQKISLVLLRISIGFLFLYAGYTKLVNPAWSAAGYLKGAKAFTGLYSWLASPGIIPTVDFLNKWGLTLLGVALILGIFTRLSAWLGALLMLLYYLPLGFPMPNTHAYIVDEHVIYIFALLVVGYFNAGRVFGLENWCRNLPICRKFWKVRETLG